MALVDVNKMATMMNITPRRVQQLAKEEGLPRAGKGRYEAGNVLLWYIRYLQDALEKKAFPAPDGGFVAIQEPRVRLMRADADFREIELARERAETIAIGDVEMTMMNLVLMAKARIMAVPPRLAKELIGEKDASLIMYQAIIEKHLKEALSVLAKSELPITPNGAPKPAPVNA